MKTMKSKLALMGMGIAILCSTAGCISVDHTPPQRDVIVTPPPAPAPVIVEPAH